jgi:hypothetical protein
VEFSDDSPRGSRSGIEESGLRDGRAKVLGELGDERVGLTLYQRLAELGETPGEVDVGDNPNLRLLRSRLFETGLDVGCHAGAGAAVAAFALDTPVAVFGAAFYLGVAADVEAQGPDADANSALVRVAAEVLEVVKARDAIGSLVEVIEEVSDGLARGFDGDLVFKSQADNPLSLTLSPQGRGDLDCAPRGHGELVFRSLTAGEPSP